MISFGLNFEEETITEDLEYGLIIRELFEDHLARQERERIFHPYVYETFGCFANHKKRIEIDIGTLSKLVQDKELKTVLFHDIIANKQKDKTEISAWIDVDDKQNLIKNEVFQVFKNVKELNIRIIKTSIACDYPFSLSLLLSMIENTSITKLMIIGSKETWLELQSSFLFKLIRNNFEDKKFKIKFVDDLSINWTGTLLICKE